MKHLPNVITVSRIVVAVVLAFVLPFSIVWYVCYAWCGMSDVLDGWLARKVGAASATGAKLDSVADCVFVAAVAIGCIPVLTWQGWMIVWVVGIAVVRLATLVLCFVRFRHVCFLHTWANKITGLMLFMVFALVPAVGLSVVAALACVVATVSAIEELVLMIRMHELNVDSRGLWDRP